MHSLCCVFFGGSSGRILQSEFASPSQSRRDSRHILRCQGFWWRAADARVNNCEGLGTDRKIALLCYASLCIVCSDVICSFQCHRTCGRCVATASFTSILVVQSPREMLALTALLGDLFPTEWPPPGAARRPGQAHPPPPGMASRAALARRCFLSPRWASSAFLPFWL